MYYLAVSMKDETLANRNVRLALRYLIDYDGINKTIMPFYGVLHQRPIQKGLPGGCRIPATSSTSRRRRSPGRGRLSGRLQRRCACSPKRRS